MYSLFVFLFCSRILSTPCYPYVILLTSFFLTTNVPTIHLLIEYQILRPPTDFRIFKILNFYYKHSIRTEAQEEFNGEKKNEKEERRRKKSDNIIIIIKKNNKEEEKMCREVMVPRARIDKRRWQPLGGILLNCVAV